MADIWNIGGALLGGLLGGQSSQQSQTQQSQPWAPAQPWIQSNINSGQALQNAYQAQPLSAGQLGSYANSFGLTNNFRNTADSLVNQMNTPTQFDRTNPLARSTPFNFSGAGTSGASGAPGGNLGMGGMYPQVGQPSQATQPAQSQFGYNAPQGSSNRTVGTNFTDPQWNTIKNMNDAYGFFGNPVNQIGLGALAGVAMPGGSLTSLSGDSPMTAQQRSIDAINAYQSAPQYAMYNNPNAGMDGAPSVEGYGGGSY